MLPQFWERFLRYFEDAASPVSSALSGTFFPQMVDFLAGCSIFSSCFPSHCIFALLFRRLPQFYFPVFLQSFRFYSHILIPKGFLFSEGSSLKNGAPVLVAQLRSFS